MKFLQRLWRRHQFRKQFVKMAIVKGLNPDKHEQMFESFFWVEENGGTLLN